MPKRVRYVQMTKPAKVPENGPTGPEWDAAQGAIDRVDPGAPLQPGESPRGTLSGVKPRHDAASPLDHDAEGDGTTNDYAAVMATYDAVVAWGGGKIDLGGRSFRCETTVELEGDVPVLIDGGAAGNADSFSPAGGMLVFPEGIDGLILGPDGADKVGGPTLRNMSVVTDHPFWTPQSSGTGHGIIIRSRWANLEHIWINGFQGDGWRVESAPYISGTNANHGQARQVSSTFNGGSGFVATGDDSNAWVLTGCDATGNGGYGFANLAKYHVTFITPHAADNTGPDYYDNAWSSCYIHPYSELERPFVIDDDSRYGTFIGGGFGTPVIWSGGVAYSDTAMTYGWIIDRYGHRETGYSLRATLGDRLYAWQGDRPNTGWLRLHDVDDNRDIISFDPGAGRLTLGPVVRIPSGTTANRPASPGNGDQYADTDLNKLITYIGGAWRDGAGSSV